jgi:hypothetical protein
MHALRTDPKYARAKLELLVLAFAQMMQKDRRYALPVVMVRSGTLPNPAPT